ncbi:hypothetical protein BRD01_10415 [Halobacteriales archaeon QS_8_65_32]|jgi:hypothetical protein|nr:MAG: hypothetical protein BRD01_10415 [Halobacteriales archaeon QS_8_65_32]
MLQDDGTDRSGRRRTVALVVGYVALAGATVSAYAAPTTGFEVSVYEGTPLSVWLLLGVALTVALLVACYAPGTRLGFAGLVLGGGAVGLVTALPLVRGYYFYGAGDGLTHLGWVSDISSGVLNPFALFYPGLHTVTVFVSRLAGVPATRALLLVVCAIALSFFLFVPLCVRAITGRPGAATVGAFVAFCLLPLNHIATHYMEPHPITQAILLSPLALYLLVQYVLCEDSLFDRLLTKTGVLLALASVSVVLYHPQQAANLFILFVTVSGVQAGCRLLRCGGEIRAHRPLYGQTAWLGVVFVGWAAGRETFVAAFSGVARELAGYLLAGSTAAATVVSQRGSSLSAIGASTAELFAKLLLVPSVFAALAAFVMLTSLLGRTETTEPETTALCRYVTAGLIVLVPYSLAFFVGSVSKLFFRNLGFVMVLVAILGAIALFRLAGLLAERSLPAVGYPATTLLLGAALVFSMVVVFPSPYVYMASGHVTDDRAGGYETLFAHQAADTATYGVRTGPWRYRHAIAGVTGTATSRYAERAIRGENLSRARALASADRYFVLSRPDVARETGVYEGLRYSESQLESLEREPGIHLVQANGAVTVYRIEARAPSRVRRPSADGSVANGSRTNESAATGS